MLIDICESAEIGEILSVTIEPVSLGALVSQRPLVSPVSQGFARFACWKVPLIFNFFNLGKQKSGRIHLCYQHSSDWLCGTMRTNLALLTHQNLIK